MGKQGPKSPLTIFGDFCHRRQKNFTNLPFSQFSRVFVVFVTIYALLCSIYIHPLYLHMQVLTLLYDLLVVRVLKKAKNSTIMLLLLLGILRQKALPRVFHIGFILFLWLEKSHSMPKAFGFMN